MTEIKKKKPPETIYSVSLIAIEKNPLKDSKRLSRRDFSLLTNYHDQ